MDARKTVPTVAVCKRSDSANREDCPHPYTFYFYFHFFFHFCFLFLFFSFFLKFSSHVLC